jgi:hypothetical protein
MNLRLTLLKLFVPLFVKKAKIQELFKLTAAAFGSTLPDLSGLGYRELLKEYACFAKAESDKVLTDTRKTAEVRSRLYKGAGETGLRLKEELKVKTYYDVVVASRIFYRVLGIEFFGDASGNIALGKCFFSRYFSPDHCALISALDEGVANGLSGGTLIFTQRITEGKGCCKANMVFRH